MWYLYLITNTLFVLDSIILNSVITKRTIIYKLLYIAIVIVLLYFVKLEFFYCSSPIISKVVVLR
jgi:hypothetical protein